MTRILVIGESGQVARALAERRSGRAMTLLGRGALDLADLEAIGPAVAAAAPDVVVNAAAYTAVDRAEEETALAERVNGHAVGRLAEAAAAAGAALVHLSTDYVYPGTGTEPHREDAPTAPVNAYGASKLLGEALARAANPRTVILRTSWVYAPWGKNFVTTMLRLADRAELRIVDDQVGHPTSAEDIAEACLAVADRMGMAGPGPAGVYHYAGRGETSWAGFARAIFGEARARGLIASAPEVVPIPTAEYPTPATRPLNSRLDCARFEATFGLAPVPWRAALGRTLARMAEPERAAAAG